MIKILTPLLVFAMLFGTAGFAKADSDADAEAALLLATARRVANLEKQNEALEKRIKVLEDQAKAAKAPVPAQTVTTTRQAVGHTHTCPNGHTWDHTMTAGHNCPFPGCGLPQFIQDPTPRAVTVGSGATTTQTYSTQSFGQTYNGYSISSSGGCANGQCSSPSTSGGGWYLGKNLGRR